MSESLVAAKLRVDRTVQQLITVSGVTLGDVRALASLLFESGPLNSDSKLSPGETAVVLASDMLSRMGFARDRALLILRTFRDPILAFMNNTAELDKLGMLIIQDSRYAMFETEPDMFFDIRTGEMLDPTKNVLPLPAYVFSLSVLGIYLRTFAKLPDPRPEEEDQKSAEPSAEASAGSPAPQLKPDPSRP